MNAVAPGALLGETKRSASYLVRSPLDFEGKMRQFIYVLSGNLLAVCMCGLRRYTIKI